jgi:hypothetical protein
VRILKFFDLQFSPSRIQLVSTQMMMRSVCLRYYSAKKHDSPDYCHVCRVANTATTWIFFPGKGKERPLSIGIPSPNPRLYGIHVDEALDTAFVGSATRVPSHRTASNLRDYRRRRIPTTMIRDVSMPYLRHSSEDLTRYFLRVKRLARPR